MISINLIQKGSPNARCCVSGNKPSGSAKGMGFDSINDYVSTSKSSPSHSVRSTNTKLWTISEVRWQYTQNRSDLPQAEFRYKAQLHFQHANTGMHVYSTWTIICVMSHNLKQQNCDATEHTGLLMLTHPLHALHCSCLNVISCNSLI
jgi:hypothetical protein